MGFPSHQHHATAAPLLPAAQPSATSLFSSSGIPTLLSSPGRCISAGETANSRRFFLAWCLGARNRLLLSLPAAACDVCSRIRSLQPETSGSAALFSARGSHLPRSSSSAALCVPAGAFPSGTISGPYPEAQRRRAPKEGGKHVARSLYVARWTSVFLLHDVIYSHTQKLSASWSFSVGFGRVEQM